MLSPVLTVFQAPFVLPWSVGGSTRISLETLSQLLDNAVGQCDAGNCDRSDDELNSWLCALYNSRIMLLLAHNKSVICLLYLPPFCLEFL